MQRRCVHFARVSPAAAGAAAAQASPTTAVPAMSSGVNSWWGALTSSTCGSTAVRNAGSGWLAAGNTAVAISVLSSLAVSGLRPGCVAAATRSWKRWTSPEEPAAARERHGGGERSSAACSQPLVAGPVRGCLLVRRCMNMFRSCLVPAASSVCLWMIRGGAAVAAAGAASVTADAGAGAVVVAMVARSTPHVGSGGECADVCIMRGSISRGGRSRRVRRVTLAVGSGAACRERTWPNAACVVRAVVCRSGRPVRL